jgi:uroporphyrinogen decarboxylase
MTREERVRRVINRKEVDYLPSEITFSDRTRDKAIHEALALPADQTLDEYLENHIGYALTKADFPLFFRNDRKMMHELEKDGWCRFDEEGKVVYDSWGMGIQVDSDGFCAVFHPLADKRSKDFVEKWMPPRIHDACMADSLEERIRLWTPPDPDQEGNYDWMVRDFKAQTGDYFVVPSGYFGLYERAYGVISITQMLEGMAGFPTAIGELLDKITDYRITVAENIVKLGFFEMGHMGDDLGQQHMPFFSLKMFRVIFLPRYKRLWKVFKDAGMPIAMHSCGNVTVFLPDLIDIGLNILHPVQPCMDIHQLKKEFGKDLIFWGGIDTQELLPFGTPEEIKAHVVETIRTLGKGGGHIIAPSQEVMRDVPFENIIVLVRTIIEERENVLQL